MRPQGLVLMEAFNLLFSEEIALWEESLFPKKLGLKTCKSNKPGAARYYFDYRGWR